MSDTNPAYSYYLIIRDQNDGSIVSEETHDPAACIMMGGAFRLLFPEVEFHTITQAGRGDDSFQLIKHNGMVCQFVHPTLDR